MLVSKLLIKYKESSNILTGGLMRRLPIGYRHTDEIRQKISAANKGRKRTDAVKQRLSEYRKSLWLDPEYREQRLEILARARVKAHEAAKEKWKDPEFRKRMAAIKRRPGTGRPITDALERFLVKIVKLENGCWQWKGKINRNGYGQFWITDSAKKKQGKEVRAHRWSYEHFKAPLSPDIDLDHRCHDAKTCQLGNNCPHRSCVNPDHLEPTTNQANVLRTWEALRPTCEEGHPLVGGNLRNKKGGRQCKVCYLLGQAKFHHRRAQSITPKAEKILKKL